MARTHARTHAHWQNVIYLGRAPAINQLSERYNSGSRLTLSSSPPNGGSEAHGHDRHHRQRKGKWNCTAYHDTLANITDEVDMTLFQVLYLCLSEEFNSHISLNLLAHSRISKGGKNTHSGVRGGVSIQGCDGRLESLPQRREA